VYKKQQSPATVECYCADTDVR